MDVAVINLTSGGLSGGYSKYLEQIVPFLSKDPRIRRLVVFIHPLLADLIRIEPDYLRVWPADDPRHRYRWLKNQLRRLTPDVMFIPTARWLDFNGTPTVVMVRNMEPLVIPFLKNSLGEGIKNLGRAYLAKRACRSANRTIAVSNYVHDFLIDKWNIHPSKIGVVYHGIENPPVRSEVVKPKVFGREQTGRFLFTAGSIRPARGLEDLVRAMAIIVRHEVDLNLVIAGKPESGTYGYRQRLEQLARKLGVASRVVWTGHLSALEMSWCLYHCEAFVMTSRTEACPNIALEAISHDCLSVVANNPPMPEFFGDAACYYKPENAQDLAEALGNVFRWDQKRCREANEWAKTQASKLSWNVCADKTVGELAKAAGNSKLNEPNWDGNKTNPKTRHAGVK